MILEELEKQCNGWRLKKQFSLADIEKVLEEYEKKQIRIFRWLLGYGRFQPRKEGEGAYWWRKNLRVLLNQIGITSEKLEQFERKQ